MAISRDAMRLLVMVNKNTKWVFVILSTFLISSSLASRYDEVKLICGPTSDQATGSTVSTNYVHNFVISMEALQNQVSNARWGSYKILTPAPQAYALVQCHLDLSETECRLCFSQGRVKVPQCLPSSSARLYLDGCFIRYDNYSFFDEPIDSKYDSIKCSDARNVVQGNSLRKQDFANKVAKVIENVTEMAIKNRSFAVVSLPGGVVPAYALAQCWNTLDAESCRQCLVMAGSKLKECAPDKEGRAMFAGCFIRYSTEKFFDVGTNTISNNGTETGNLVVMLLSIAAFVLLASFGAFIGYRKVSKHREDKIPKSINRLLAMSSLSFKYEVLEQATDFFSDSTKLGQGGAGTVFKGVLPGGRIVAVKRLVYNTRQWADQFFNEVNLISNIHHNNLVRLLGCSIEGPESLLVYEYVPNRSLDQILFVEKTIHLLSWEQRFVIILGTAEGLAYLHGGYAEKIIHRDIKAGNILLDENFNPKIADFGLARCFASDNSHISTGIAGTLGYMAPEYLIRGQLTEKADVYAFGVLVLEIASGKKNNVFSQGSRSILHSVWKHYKAKKITKAIDPGLGDGFPEKEAATVLQIGLLCTQASPSLRPSMAEVLRMLKYQEAEIPTPKQPPFLNATFLCADEPTENSITQALLTRSSDVNQKLVGEIHTGENNHCSFSVTLG